MTTTTLTANPRMRLVGEYLRRHREAAGWTIGDAARVLDCHASKVSRIETGERGIRGKELRDLMAEYGAHPAVVQTLEALARFGPRPSGWWTDYDKVLPGPYLELVSAEACASSEAVYAPFQVPELLQVPEYTAAVAAADPFVPHEQERAFAEAVRARQRVVLTERALPLEVVLGEASLRSKAGGPLVMRAQLTHLAETAENSAHVTIRLLPFTAGPSALGGGGEFTVLRFGPVDLGLVHLADPSGGLYPVGLQAASSYRTAFEHIQAQALNPEQTTRRVRELLAAL
jgi:Domain of unknown function (DUF5753)/Helix-turn-helix domain